MSAQRFPIRIGRRSRLPLLAFGVREANSYVELTDDELDAHFGFFRFRAPLSNIVRWRIEGPWRSITAVGVRRSVRHGDITFGGNGDGGVRVDFRERIAWFIFRVPALYVTVADMKGLAVGLVERGVPGEDARKNDQ